MEYKDVLSFYMEQKGISMAELSRRADVPKTTINDMLKGRTKEPTLGRAAAIADALGVTLQEMADMAFKDGE